MLSLCLIWHYYYVFVSFFPHVDLLRHRKIVYVHLFILWSFKQGIYFIVVKMARKCENSRYKTEMYLNKRNVEETLWNSKHDWYVVLGISQTDTKIMKKKVDWPKIKLIEISKLNGMNWSGSFEGITSTPFTHISSKTIQCSASDMYYIIQSHDISSIIIWESVNEQPMSKHWLLSLSICAGLRTNQHVNTSRDWRIRK